MARFPPRCAGVKPHRGHPDRSVSVTGTPARAHPRLTIHSRRTRITVLGLETRSAKHSCARCEECGKFHHNKASVGVCAKSGILLYELRDHMDTGLKITPRPVSESAREPDIELSYSLKNRTYLCVMNDQRSRSKSLYGV
jgi:hypothetical protein